TIDGGKNSRADRNLFALEPIRIAAAIPTLVMRAHDGHYRIRKVHTLKNFRPDDGVDLHFFKFFSREPSGLGDDVLWNGELADIVQQSSGAQSFDFILRKIKFFSYFNGVDAHALQMIMRGLVFGFNGQGQSLNGTHVQRSHFSHVVLLIFQLAEIKTIRTVDHEHRGQGQQGRLPSYALVDPSEERSDGAASQIIWQRPEIAISPDFLQPLVLGKRDDGGDRQRIK